MLTTGVILAGGLGTRLRPLTNTTPKPLLPIKQKPIIEHIITNMKEHGVTDIILSIGYKADIIKDYFGDGSKFGVTISYCIEDEPLGTGGAIRQATRECSDPVFLAWGDNLMDIDWKAMHEVYAQTRVPIVMALTHREDVEHFGVAQLEENKIVAFVEKPTKEQAPSTLINAGAFILDPHCLDVLPKGKCSIEKDCFEHLALNKKIAAYVHKGQWFPTDTLEKYNKANKEFIP